MRPKIKICGITNGEDARAAIRAGADMLGFVFYPKSLRYREPAVIERLVNELKTEGAELALLVGVFVNESVEDILRIARRCSLGAIQMHGLESSDEARELRAEGLRVFKAFHVKDAGVVEQFGRYDVDAYLCDTPDPRLWGGTGQTFDHTLLAGASKAHRIILAGGLNPGNVAAAIRLVRPWAVDVSSGVEIEPGKKGHAKITAFIQAVREAG